MALSDKRITALNRRDQETKQVAGVTYKMIHGGQKRYKGDMIYEYEVDCRTLAGRGNQAQNRI